MNNKLPTVLLTIAALVGFLVAAPTKAFAAPRLTLEPATITSVKNTEFQVKIKIDAETNSVMGSDAVINYAGADMTVTAVASGGYFPDFTYANNTAGRIELHGYVSASYDSRTGAGTLATITLKPSKGSGSSTISFTCAGGGNDTNILTTAGANVLSCSSLNQAGVSYTGDATPTLTPTPTTPPGVTATPTPTQVPGTNANPVCASLAPDITTATGAPLAVTFLCSGVDPDGDITAAEFVFGDGTSQVIQKNVGSPGTLSTTHTYTTIGTLGASCRVRDNNQVYSSVSAGCQKIITIRPRPTGTAQAGATRAPIASPTPEVVAMISETPEPTVAPTLYPQVQEEPSETGPGKFWWIVGGVVAVVVGFFLLRLRRPPPPTTIPPVSPPGDIPQMPQTPQYNG